jgi:hypothetical protein
VAFTVCSERTSQEWNYWLDLPDDLAPSKPPANALALFMLPLGCYYNEDVRVGEPVDAVLLDNLKGVQQIWRTWYPELSAVQILAPRAAPRANGTDGRTLASFSGGIDSFFSLLQHRDAITDLVSIAGFNTPMDDLDNIRAHLGPIAQRFDKRHIPVVNIRYGDHPPTPYSIEELMVGLSHGCLLAAIAHTMAARFGAYVIPATHSFSHLQPLGSHPLTDPLFSSSTLRVVHDGAAFDRVERTRVVAQSVDALSALHVCWQDFRQGNCSKCQKCLRTMATLVFLGAKERAISFDWSGFSLERLAATWLPTQSERDFFRELADAARAKGDLHLSRALDTAVVSSRRKAMVLDAARSTWRLTLRGIKSTVITRSMWNALRALRSRATHESSGYARPPLTPGNTGG